MPTNIEIKARVTDMPGMHALVTAISDTPPQTLSQRDTFFRCPHGRLKLRETGCGPAELIFYARADSAAARRSDYAITPVADPESLRGVLARALGVMQTVVKTRVLCLVGQTRVHLDSVDGLGDFLELEVVLRPGQEVAHGEAVAADVMRRLGIRDHDLIATAYADMLGASVVDGPAAPARDTHASKHSGRHHPRPPS